MKSNKAADYRQRGLTGLRSDLEDLVKEQFKLKMQHGSGNLAANHKLKQMKKDIARMKTIISEEERKASA